MALPSNPNRLLINRVTQAVHYLREYWSIANHLIIAIDGGTLTGVDLSYKLNSAVYVRENLATSIGGAGNSDVRTEMAVQYGIGSITSEISAANVASAAMLTEMNDLLIVVADGGQIFSANDTIGMVNSNLTSPETDALRAACITLRDTAISDPEA